MIDAALGLRDDVVDGGVAKGEHSPVACVPAFLVAVECVLVCVRDSPMNSRLIERVLMHNDEPVLQDALERGVLIKEVGEAIAQCIPPQVFGVHGDWGLGKTSFLHQIQWYITGDCPQQPESVTEQMKKQANSPEASAPAKPCGVFRRTIQAVWFDAWRYQNEEVPVVALLHEMRAQLTWGTRVVNAADRTAKVAVRGALLSMEDVTRKIGFQYSKLRRANREWEVENLAATLPSHTLRDHLRSAVEQLLPEEVDDSPPPRLVVFIDDVDRCEPEAAYRLLEGLKIYLTLDNCVFVLGMNQKAIEEAIAQRMKAKSGDNPTMRAAAYMEKLCQNVWRLPAVREPAQVLHRLLEGTVKSPTVREWVKRGVDAPEYPCLPPNPRRLKGLANLIGRLSPRLPSQNGAPHDERSIYETQLLVIVAYTYQFHHDLYVRWEADSTLYDKIREWCEAAPTLRDATNPSDAQPLRFLEPLTLPLQGASEGVEGPTPTEFESTFPDPTEANVFWIQSLILHLGQTVPLDRFERYLHGAPE